MTKMKKMTKVTKMKVLMSDHNSQGHENGMTLIKFHLNCELVALNHELTHANCVLAVAVGDGGGCENLPKL